MSYATTPSSRQLCCLEEDHFRIQGFAAGLNATIAAQLVQSCAKVVAEQVELAADDQFGYLTACPTNVGTGLRLSAMVHLPALIAGGVHEQLHAACRSLRLQARGIHGEGSKPIGRVLQISNAGCFGVDEGQMVEEFTRAMNALVRLRTRGS